MIRSATPADAGPICDIYNHYVAETVITFEEQCVSEGEMARRMESVASRSLPWLVDVDEDSGAIRGYAYVSPWKTRSAYRFTLEATVYVDASCAGQGRGGELYARLLELAREAGAHVVVGVIALPNPASVALHERLGFAKVAHLHEVGFKFDRWIDVGVWEVRLEPGGVVLAV